MFQRLIGTAAISAAVVLGSCVQPAVASEPRAFDHVWVIMMENQSFDNAIGRNRVDVNGNILEPLTPFITQLASAEGLATLYFGVTHPSEPNYLATVAGDYFGVQDDNPSCFAKPAPGPACNHTAAANIVDSLESQGKTWDVLEESMPFAGFLGTQYPGSDPRLYAQKHNPFVYFDDIATNPTRLNKIRPLTSQTLAAAVAKPANFEYLVPNQCNDMHGTTTCTSFDDLLKQGDREVSALVTAITSAPTFTSRSAVFVVWDEDDYSSNWGCCSSLPRLGGGHTVAIVVSKSSAGLRSGAPMNHYSLLKTIEQGFGLPLLGHSADPAIATLWDLFGATPSH